MNAFLTKDHHTKQRLHALRGYARKADRLLDKPKPNWLLIGLVMALVLAFAYGMGIDLAIAAVFG